MGARLTLEQRDARELAVVRNYLQAYANWKKISRVSTLSPEAENAWRVLMATQKQYKKVAKLNANSQRSS